jgi:LuxR family transcriptional regulator, maltose regulon positive regulatory protein
MLPRRHLVEALASHVDRKVQLVIAPAGFGKTSLLSEFAHEAELPVCWVNLTPDHGDLADFLVLLATALDVQIPGFGQRTLLTLGGCADAERSIDALAHSFAADAAVQIEDPILLIIDDFHEVNDSLPILRFLVSLLRLLPDTLRMLLASRVLPALPLARLALENDVYSLGVADLRFTDEELQTLVRLRGMDHLAPKQVQELAVQFEGWIAGFLLAVSREDTRLAGRGLAPNTSTDLLYDYLASEVFDRQPPDVQRFLLATSVPEIAEPGLCRALLGAGDWEAMTRAVAAANLFLTPVGDGGSFRYHQLFRDFLQDRLRHVAPDEYRRLRVLTGEHLAAQGEWRAALAHFRAVEAVAEQVRLVARVVPELEALGRWRAVDTAVQGLTIDQLSHDPKILLTAAWAAQQLEDFPRALALAGAAQEAGIRLEDAGIEARALARLGMMHQRQGRLKDAIQLLHRSQARAPDDGELVATVQFYLGQILGPSGELGGAIAHFRTALAYFDEAGPAVRAADTEYALALALTHAGRLSEAAARYDSVRERWRRLGNSELEASALHALGDVHVRQGDYERARVCLEEALERARTGGSIRTEADSLYALGWRAIAIGEPEAAASTFEQGLAVAQELDDLRLQMSILEGMALADAFQGDLAQAEEHAHKAVALAERRNQRLLAAMYSLTLGAIEARVGRPMALARVQQAADQLAQMEAGWPVARAQAWLAQLHFKSEDRQTAFEHLRTALDVAQANGSDALFDLHVRWDPDLIQAALAAGVEPERLRALLARVSGQRPAPMAVAAQRSRMVEARGFGPGIATVDGSQHVVWRRDKSRELFFLLLYRGPQRYDQLTEALWPDSPPARAHASLHTAVTHLRRAVHERIVVRAAGMYRINEPELAHYDVAVFEHLLQQAADVSATAAIATLRQAVELYTAPFLSDTSAEWCEGERDRLERLYLAALTRLTGLHAAAEQHHESIAVAQRLLQTDPYREDAHAAIVRAHLRLGNRAAALRQFKECSRLLRDDLGVSPGSELIAVLGRGEH